MQCRWPGRAFHSVWAGAATHHQAHCPTTSSGVPSQYCLRIPTIPGRLLPAPKPNVSEDPQAYLLLQQASAAQINSGGGQEADWRPRESAILALGAIAEGCAQGLLPWLPNMIAMLLPKLSDTRPLVRSITCWALSRYSLWIVQAAVENPTAGFRKQYLDVLQVRFAAAIDTQSTVSESRLKPCLQLLLYHTKLGIPPQTIALRRWTCRISHRVSPNMSRLLDHGTGGLRHRLVSFRN